MLDEILAAIDGLNHAISGKTQADFDGDWLLQRGAERALDIISEAARHLPEDVTTKEPDIPWAAIRAAGNRLRHEYHRTSSWVVWSTIIDDLPPLEAAVRRLKSGP